MKFLKMLTPRFELIQTENELTVTIHAPYANIKDTVINIDGTDFRFYSTPYYLRLNLPGKIEENDSSTGDYNCDKGDFKLKFSKVHKGEYFENLDMITTLLAPIKKKKNLIPMVEVLSNPCTNDEIVNENKTWNKNEDDIKSINDPGDEWYIKQNLKAENMPLSIQTPKYGFANKISGALNSFEDTWIKEIIDVPTPDKTLSEDRKKLREYDELKSFNEQHYMADFVESNCIELYLTYECEWDNLIKEDVQFNDIEKDLLKELPNKEYLLDENEIKVVLYSMVDILFASCYNCRTTLGENTVESGWTINKLSSTLSWFQIFLNMNDVILSCLRRSLCYPLIRNWNLSMRVFQDVKMIIKLGKKYILKRFCEIYSLFNNSYEPRYILNQLYIQDYLIWLQQISNSKIEEIDLLLKNIVPTKEELGLDLTKIEEAVYIVQNENLIIENDLYTLPTHFEKLIFDNGNNYPEKSIFSLKSATNSDSESDSSSSSSTTSSTSSSTSSNSTDHTSITSKINCIDNSNNSSALDSDDEPN